MNNIPNGPFNRGAYYQPPNYYQQYGYNGNPAPGNYRPNKQPHIVAAESALETMNMPLFLIFSIIFGWVCSRTILSGRLGVGMTFTGVLFYAFFMPLILHKQDKKIPISAWFLFIPQIAVLISFALYSSQRNKICGLLISLGIAAIQTTLIAGCTNGRPFSKELLSDVCTSYLAYPFMNMGQTLRSLFGIGKDRSGRKMSKVVPKILIGILISIPVVIILILMMSNADKMFLQWICKAIDSIDINIGRIFGDIILTAIVMLYVMPLVVTLRSGYHNESVEKVPRRPLDAIIVTTVLFAASVIYLMFVAVQFTYLFANGSSLPESLSYAEYCRRGFFELVSVTAVTTIVIAVVCMLTTHNENDKLPAYTKAALLIISACDCVMIVSAAYRLMIYVREYNMTIARFNAAVIIAFMAVCIIVMSLKILFEKLKISPIIGSAVIVIMSLYSVFNVDGFIARYNIDKYLADTKSEFDVNYITCNLSPAAVMELDRMDEISFDPKIKSEAEYAIAAIANDYSLFSDDCCPLADWTWDRYQASKIIENFRFNYDHNGDSDNAGVGDDVSASYSDIKMQ